MNDYTKYAIGEIILVVIGILIALQINNWNGDRKTRKEMFLTLEILNQSFKKNKNEIEKTLTDYHEIIKVTNLRIKNTGPNIDTVSQGVIDSIRLIDIAKLELANNLNSNILIDYKNSSLLNSKLRNLLLDYTSSYKKYISTEENVAIIQLKLRENHQKHIALLQELTDDNNFNVDANNKFKSSYNDWLRDRQNQNLSVESKWKMDRAIKNLIELRDLNELILESLSNVVD